MIKLAALLLGCLLVTLSIQAPVFALAQGAAITSQNWQTSTTIFPEIPGYELKFGYRDLNFEERVPGELVALLYYYKPLPSAPANPIIWIMVGVADAKTTLHSWEVCLAPPFTDEPALVLDNRDVQILENPLIIARYYVFQERPARVPEITQITLYWYERALFNTGTTIQQKYVRISLIILTENQDDYPALEEELLPLGKSIASYWEPLKSQTLASFGVPILQATLIGSIAALVVIRARAQRKEENNLKIFESFASSDEKLVLKILQDLGIKTKEITPETVQHAIKKTTDTHLESKRIVEILNNLENLGIIRKDLTNTQNDLRLIWKF